LAIFWSILFAFSPFRERILSLKEKQTISSEGELAGRFTVWRAVFYEIRKNPILGKGINTTRAHIIRKYCHNSKFAELLAKNHPHSIYLYIWLEAGILGLLAYLWFIWRILKIIFSLKRNILSFGFLVSIVGFLSVNLTDLMWGERLQGLFWGIIGLLVVYKMLDLKNE